MTEEEYNRMVDLLVKVTQAGNLETAAIKYQAACMGLVLLL